MPSLTTIPRELRDQICEYVILAPTREPPGLDQSFEQLIDGYVTYKRPEPDITTGAAYRPQAIVSNADNLLLVNQQLRTETAESLKRIKNITYELDIIIADEVIPVATWTCIPVLTTKVEQLNATFRISGSYNYSKSRHTKDRDDYTPAGAYAQFGNYTGWNQGDGGPPALYWQIYSLLVRFIRVGPLGERTRDYEHHHFTVKTLNINVETPPGIDPSRFSSSTQGGRSVERSILSPEYLADFLEGELVGLVHRWFSYGKVLFEHVDEIRLSKDGEERWRVDVAERLRDYPEKDEETVAYTKEAWRLRRERGLKVLE